MHSTRYGDDDNKSLRQLQFQVGICVLVFVFGIHHFRQSSVRVSLRKSSCVGKSQCTRACSVHSVRPCFVSLRKGDSGESCGAGNTSFLLLVLMLLRYTVSLGRNGNHCACVQHASSARTWGALRWM